MKRFIVPVLAILPISVLYFGWQNEGFTEAEDSIVFLSNISGGTPNLHPNHLIFEPVFHSLFRFVQFVAPGMNPIHSLQVITSAFAVASLGLIYGLVASRRGEIVAVITMAGVAFLSGFWLYGKVIDVYVPALFFALLGIWLFDRRGSGSPYYSAAAIAAVLALATLFHQQYLLLALVVLCFLLSAPVPANPRWGPAFVYCATGIVIVAPPYLLAAGQATSEPLAMASLFKWSLGYASGGLWSPPSAATLIHAPIGLGSAIWFPTGFLVMAKEQDQLQHLFPNISLLEEFYLANEALAPWQSLVVIAGILASVLSGIWLLLRGADFTSKREWSDTERLLLVSVCLYAGFAILWEASNREFWIHPVVFATILVGLRLRDEPKSIIVSGVAVVLLAFTNFFGGILHYSKPENDFWLNQLSVPMSHFLNDSIVIADCGWLCARYLEAFSAVDVVELEDLGQASPAPVPEGIFLLRLVPAPPIRGDRGAIEADIEGLTSVLPVRLEVENPGLELYRYDGLKWVLVSGNRQ